jgi:hypothetical protein
MTVRELLERIDSRELSEWLAYFKIEPLPDPFWIGGLQCSTLVNLWSKSRTTPEDFMPRAAGTPPVDTAAVDVANMKLFAARHNAALQAGCEKGSG